MIVKNIFSKIVLLAIFLLPTIAFSSNDEQLPDAESVHEEEIEITEMIMHHISDSHEFHILDLTERLFQCHCLSFYGREMGWLLSCRASFITTIPEKL